MRAAHRRVIPAKGLKQDARVLESRERTRGDHRQQWAGRRGGGGIIPRARHFSAVRILTADPALRYARPPLSTEYLRGQIDDVGLHPVNR